MALKLVEPFEDHKAICLNNIGLVYRTLGDYPKALRGYENALIIYESLGNLSKKAMCLNNIGIIYLNLGYYSISM